MKRLIFILFIAFSFTAMAQSYKVSGYVTTANGTAQSGVLVTMEPTGLSQITNTLGYYEFLNVPQGNYTLKFGEEGSEVNAQEINVNNDLVIDDYVLKTGQEESETTYITDLSLLEGNDEDEAVSSILTASRDVFLNKAGFQFGSDTFFRVRGYDSRYQSFMLNGVRFENPETGWQPFSLVGGLNDVLRYRETETVGIAASTNTFGDVGGTRDYVLRPSAYRKGGRVTYSHLNRSYNNRVMATYASGDRNGLSYVVSGSHRWAQEAFVDGTYYDAYAFHAAVEGKITDNYSIMGSFTMSPRRRGTQSIHTQEAYDLAGSNFYNADWGFQNGEKRNARLRKNDNPLVMVSNYIDVSNKTTLNVTGSYMTGFFKASRIERNGGRNPDPDYYQNLPSFDGNQSGLAPFLFEQQINWPDLYAANAGGPSTYILEENVREDKEYQAVAQFTTDIQSNISLDYGANYRNYTGNFYGLVNDLLGGTSFFNGDVFAGTLNDVNGQEFVGVDDVYGHDHDLNKEEVGGYAQARIALNRVDLHIGGNVGRTAYFREGYTANEMTRDDVITGEFGSLGESDLAEFNTFGGKAGGTYKIDGRNYVSLNSAYYQKAPYMQTVFINPEIRNQLNEEITEETIYTGELNFLHKSPALKLRATGYYTQFQDQAENILSFSEGLDAFVGSGGDNAFGSYLINGIDKLHYGGELGFAYNISPEFEASGAASVGNYRYTSRPTISVYDVDSPSPVLSRETVYLDNFYEDNTPQSAYNLGLTWRSPFYMFANIDANFYDDVFAGPSALRRTEPIARNLAIVEGLDQEQSVEYWTRQERLPNAFRLNASLYKSIRLPNREFIGINFIVNNVLDADDYPNLAFEQLRLDNNNGSINPDAFPTRYRYATGRTYFINVNYRFN